MCLDSPCDLSPGFGGIQIQHHGLEAVIVKCDDIIWRGSPMPAPSTYKLDILFPTLSEAHVIPELLSTYSCDRWWWSSTPLLSQALNARFLDTWLSLVRALANWHIAVSALDVPLAECFPKWDNGYAILQDESDVKGFCHTDLHDENAMADPEGNLFILDGWAPLYGPLGIDFGVLAVGAVTVLNDWSVWEKMTAAYKIAGGNGHVDALPIHALFQLVAGYGSDDYATQVLVMLDTIPVTFVINE